jgi:hypothetical protein
MGDGINDAPALRVADVGISVDTATDIAKESADLILLEKDLMVLEGGVTEGRKVFANILKYIRMGTTLSGSTRTIIYVMWSGISVNQCPFPGKAGDGVHHRNQSSHDPGIHPGTTRQLMGNPCATDRHSLWVWSTVFHQLDMPVRSPNRTCLSARTH